MKKINPLTRNFIIGTVIIVLGMTFVAILAYYFLNFIVSIVTIVISFILEYYWMTRYDAERKVQKKSKMIEVGLIADDENIQEQIDEEKDRLSRQVDDKKFVSTQLLDKFRNYLKLMITEISEIEVDIDNLYRTCIDMIDDGKTMKAKDHFRIMSNANRIRINDMNEEFKNKFEYFFGSKLKSQKTHKFLDSFKEEWENRKQKTQEIIREKSKKFEIKSYFQHHVEDVFNFEIEKKRKFNFDDNILLKIPTDQLKKIIETIEKPSILNFDELSQEKKQELGKIGKKVIAYFANNNQKPNLPAMVMKLGIALSEAKDVLVYLKHIGMMEEVNYHVKR